MATALRRDIRVGAVGVAAASVIVMAIVATTLGSPGPAASPSPIAQASLPGTVTRRTLRAPDADRRADRDAIADPRPDPDARSRRRSSSRHR